MLDRKCNQGTQRTVKSLSVDLSFYLSSDLKSNGLTLPGREIIIRIYSQTTLWLLVTSLELCWTMEHLLHVSLCGGFN